MIWGLDVSPRKKKKSEREKERRENDSNFFFFFPASSSSSSSSFSSRETLLSFFLSVFLTFWVSFYVWRTRACVQIHIHTARCSIASRLFYMCFRLEMFASRLYIISSFPPRHRYNRSPPLFNYHLINQKSISVLWNGDSLSLSLLATRDLFSPQRNCCGQRKRETQTNRFVERSNKKKKKKRKKIVSFFW